MSIRVASALSKSTRTLFNVDSILDGEASPSLDLIIEAGLGPASCV
eukprot:CAMPEP_0206614232 /NCGR_PEP_ID=MMETSP0325_2-20121206/57245_1 /ASSEMBLY_ACC=CAM_ASM_000347 /TAXON_ID=2866 /ORGANISM="Crypthecodinium cohnii, Strain Seligo" /LENGTH=45 /DNA_ID= /DNA_START= /DNA_END= /DNA_ORIENTATION=